MLVKKEENINNNEDLSQPEEKVEINLKTLEGTLLTVTYHNKHNFFTVMQAKIDSHHYPVTVTGTCTDIDLFPSIENMTGLKFQAIGKWEEHPKYGPQFKANTISIVSNNLIGFLTKMVSGIGPNLARKIIDHFGEAQLKVILDTQPEKLLEVKGIKQKKLQKIIESWNKVQFLQRLSNFFYSYGISLSYTMILKIYKHFKEDNKDPIKEIQANPYCLTEIDGIGFKTADNLALKLGTDPNSEARINALVEYILSEEAFNNGHTYISPEYLTEKANEYISKDTAPTENLRDIIYRIIGNPKQYYFDGTRVAFSWLFQAEKNLWRILVEKAKSSFKETAILNAKLDPFAPDPEEVNIAEFIESKEKEMGIKLDSDQKQAISKFISNKPNLFILCGYAGTGKTTVSKILLDYCALYFDKDEIITCALTGIASRRISEKTEFPGMTIHSLLGFNPHTRGFIHNEYNPLPYKVILVDEASMINLILFYHLMKAVPDDAVVILVGDDAQLPPIGEGNVFADLLKKEEILKAKLQQIHRQKEGSVISEFAYYIRKGMVLDQFFSKYRDYEFIKKDIANYWKLKNKLSENEMQEEREKLYLEIQKELIQKVKETFQADTEKNILKKLYNVQVITPKKDSLLGTRELNNVLQDILNPTPEKEVIIRNHKLKIKDKVIHTKNQSMQFVLYSDYEKIRNAGGDLLDIKQATYKEDAFIKVFNGNIGIVRDIDEENELFLVFYPGLLKEPVLIFYSFDDYKTILDLGYALTIHKVQGSQFKHVIMPLVNAFYIMLNNKLLYTAVTRAEEKITIIGQPSAMKIACNTTKEMKRNTFLGDPEIIL